MADSDSTTSPIRHEEIDHYADDQRNWSALIPAIKRTKCLVQSTSDLTIHGDAPKCFLLVKEYEPGRPRASPRRWPRYIAKVGSKKYPIESITEQLITRLGQCLGFPVAESKLCIVGGQVRFLSRYFLRRDEALTHGIELFRDDFGTEIVDEIAARKSERQFYTFPIVIASMRRAFPDAADEVVAGFIDMLFFDALVGNNDRHPANWGVVTSTRTKVAPRFSPIFDTARGLFWNSDEQFIRTRLADPEALAAYVANSRPQVGWDGENNLNHFDLLRRISENYPSLRQTLKNQADSLDLDRCGTLLRDEFSALMTAERVRLILECLKRRFAEVRQAVG
jgi:hypothetical protein